MFDSIHTQCDWQKISNSSAKFATELNSACSQNADHIRPFDTKHTTAKTVGDIPGKSNNQNSSQEKPNPPKGLELPSPYPSGTGNDSAMDLPKIDLPTKMVGPDPRTMRDFAEKLKAIFFGNTEQNAEHHSQKASEPQSTNQLLDKSALKKALKSAEIAISQGVSAAFAKTEISPRK